MDGLQGVPRGGLWPADSLGDAPQLHAVIAPLAAQGLSPAGPSSMTHYTTCQYSSQMCRGLAWPCQMCQAFPTHPASPQAHCDYYLTLAFPASVRPKNYRLGGSSVSIRFKVLGPGAHSLSKGLFLKDPVRTFISPVAVIASSRREDFCGTLSVPHPLTRIPC